MPLNKTTELYINIEMINRNKTYKRSNKQSPISNQKNFINNKQQSIITPNKYELYKSILSNCFCFLSLEQI